MRDLIASSNSFGGVVQWGESLRTRASYANGSIVLSETIGYDETEVGANWFRFDAARFLTDHRDWVLDEIIGCELWSPDIEPLVTGWMDRLPGRERLDHALHALFVVSGWHNHSRHLTR